MPIVRVVLVVLATNLHDRLGSQPDEFTGLVLLQCGELMQLSSLQLGFPINMRKDTKIMQHHGEHCAKLL